MKRRCILWLLFITIAVCTIGGCTPATKRDASDIYRNLINKEYALALDANNSEYIFDEDKWSIDTSYVTCFEIEPEYVLELLHGDLLWNQNLEKWVQQYIEPWSNVLSTLTFMKDAADSENWYGLLNVKEYTKFKHHYSVLFLDANNNRLYMFYIDT